MREIPQFVVAAPSSGAGKTTVSRGLMALLSGRGLKVQPFKCGPDYIDTKFHTAVCGRPSVNLDLFMASCGHVRELYARYSAGADVCVVEGMMGMFDGYDRARGSAAHVAAVLGLPVVLVVDARSAAYSLAPLLYGFTRWPLPAPSAPSAAGHADCGIPAGAGVRVAGVIFNRVGSERHRRMLRRVCADAGVECFGFLPKCAAVDHPSRYLGLDFSKEAVEDELVRIVGDGVDWRMLLAKVSAAAPQPPAPGTVPSHVTPASGIHCDKAGRASESVSVAAAGRLSVAVASSSDAFSFVYQEHLDLLHGMGRVTLFDPEADEPLPAGTSLLYLPGGYPEHHAAGLSRAGRTLESVRRYAAGGGCILAECGGMMYLSRSIATDDGVFPMAGVLPCDITARTADRRLTLGYRRFELGGCRLSGHEFHYSRFAGDVPQSAAQVTDAAGEPVDTVVMRRGNVIAGYTHLYWGETGLVRLFGRRIPEV